MMLPVAFGNISGIGGELFLSVSVASSDCSMVESRRLERLSDSSTLRNSAGSDFEPVAEGCWDGNIAGLIRLREAVDQSLLETSDKVWLQWIGTKIGQCRIRKRFLNSLTQGRWSLVGVGTVDFGRRRYGSMVLSDFC